MMILPLNKRGPIIRDSNPGRTVKNLRKCGVILAMNVHCEGSFSEGQSQRRWPVWSVWTMQLGSQDEIYDRTGEEDSQVAVECNNTSIPRLPRISAWCAHF